MCTVSGVFVYTYGPFVYKSCFFRSISFVLRCISAIRLLFTFPLLFSLLILFLFPSLHHVYINDRDSEINNDAGSQRTPRKID